MLPQSEGRVWVRSARSATVAADARAIDRSFCQRRSSSSRLVVTSFVCTVMLCSFRALSALLLYLFEVVSQHCRELGRRATALSGNSEIVSCKERGGASSGRPSDLSQHCRELGAPWRVFRKPSGSVPSRPTRRQPNGPPRQGRHRSMRPGEHVGRDRSRTRGSRAERRFRRELPVRKKDRSRSGACRHCRPCVRDRVRPRSHPRSRRCPTTN